MLSSVFVLQNILDSWIHIYNISIFFFTFSLAMMIIQIVDTMVLIISTIHLLSLNKRNNYIKHRGFKFLYTKVLFKNKHFSPLSHGVDLNTPLYGRYLKTPTYLTVPTVRIRFSTKLNSSNITLPQVHTTC